MNTYSHDSIESGSAPHPMDATLRLIAHARVPEGLEERVHARLRSAPRTGAMLAWPIRAYSDWMRSAAAAAIVAVVIGGGWGVYSHVERTLAAKAIVRPTVGAAGGGFSSAGAMRTPQTVNGPVLQHTVSQNAGKSSPQKQAQRVETAPVAGQSGLAGADQKTVQPAANAAAR